MESALSRIFERSYALTKHADQRFKRSLYHRIDWNQRLLGIKGARGVGKTTILLQRLQSLNLPTETAIYLSMDNVFLSGMDVPELLDDYYKRGGRMLFLDEVHKYKGWSALLKHLYDAYPDLKLVFTGSSVIDIARREADLTRRARMYHLHGLSFREYMAFKDGINLPEITLEEIITNASEKVKLLPEDFQPLKHFEPYLRRGYYPFFKEDPEGYPERLQHMLRLIVEYDMAEIAEFDLRNAAKVLRLVAVIAGSVPFKPNISKLAVKTEIHRNSLTQYLHYLAEAKVIRPLYPSGKSSAVLQKPEKIYLDNTNLIYALDPSTPDTGNLRETFFAEAVSRKHRLNFSGQGDFFVDDQYTFEVGGPGKTMRQIKHLDNAWLVKDRQEYPVGRDLPLWMFGLLD